MSPTKITILVSLIAIAIVISTPFLIIKYFESKYPIIIRTFDFYPENKFLQSTQNKIIREAGSEFIAPKDELDVRINLSNKHTGNIHLQIYSLVSVGGDHPKIKKLSDFFLVSNTTESYTINAVEEGLNKADFVITISNSTTGKFLQNMTGTTDFQVVSPIVRLQEYGNYIIFVALVVSIAALVSNMIISMKGQHLSKTQITELKIQNVLLKEQNEQLRKQAENQDKLTKRQLNTTTLFKVFELLSSPDIRRARTEMYNEYWKLVDRKKEVNFDNSKEKIKSRVDQLLSSFDQVSALVLNGSIDKEIFFDLYGEMIVRDGNALADTIRRRQKDNSRTLYHYTKLLKEFEGQISDKSRVQPYRRTHHSKIS